jgi:hypothetical protein
MLGTSFPLVIGLIPLLVLVIAVAVRPVPGNHRPSVIQAGETLRQFLGS